MEALIKADGLQPREDADQARVPLVRAIAELTDGSRPSKATKAGRAYLDRLRKSGFDGDRRVLNAAIDHPAAAAE